MFGTKIGDKLARDAAKHKSTPAKIIIKPAPLVHRVQRSPERQFQAKPIRS